jgi:hypothetical protein
MPIDMRWKTKEAVGLDEDKYLYNYSSKKASSLSFRELGMKLFFRTWKQRWMERLKQKDPPL